MPRAPTDDQLVLQIFPRGEPSRAITYAGDQAFIRGVLQDLGPRLEEAAGSRDPELHVLDRDEDDEEGEG